MFQMNNLVDGNWIETWKCSLNQGLNWLDSLVHISESPRIFSTVEATDENVGHNYGEDLDLREWGSVGKSSNWDLGRSWVNGKQIKKVEVMHL